MSYISTGSKLSASRICQSDDAFTTWANEVPALYKPLGLDDIPSGPVADAVKESQRLPEWIFDRNSPNYQMLEKLYPREVRYLQALTSPSKEATTSDPSVSDDLIHAMPHLTHIVRRHTALRNHESFLPSHEADLRQPLDRLALHAWDSSLEANNTKVFCTRSECALKLPQTKSHPIASAIPDSVSFLLDSDWQYDLNIVVGAVADGMSCTVNTLARLVLVHWVTEYKDEKPKLGIAERQVYYGMVAGLWQRRILGRLDDYVFGTAQGGAYLNVYAARWQKRPTSGSNQEGASGPKAKTPTSVVTSSDTSGKSFQGERRNTRSTRSRGSNTLNSEPTPPLTSDGNRASDQGPADARQEQEDYQIVVYKLQEYTTGNLVDMIHFYLLMRASRKLADEYRNQIFNDMWTTFVSELKNRQPFNWAPQPPSPSRSNNAPKLGLVPELPEHPNPGTGLAIDYTGETRWAYEAASPEQEAEWKRDWACEQRDGVRVCGPGSLIGFGPAEEKQETLSLTDRVSAYLNTS